MILLPALASVSAPHPAPESLVPQFWAIAFYGAFFAWGTLIHTRPDWLQRARPLVPWLIAGSVALYAVFLWRIAIPPARASSSPRGTSPHSKPA